MSDQIHYTNDLAGVIATSLSGFFEGWPDPPTPETHLDVLRGSHTVWLAIDGEQVVGFITAVSDGVLSAYIPLLEVLSTHRGRGIGTELVRRMLDSLDHLYMIDLMCDEEVQPFYEDLGMRKGVGMLRRNYDHQRGAAPT